MTHQPMGLAVHHVGLVVADLDRMAAFYADLLEQPAPSIHAFDADYMAEKLGFDAVGLRIAFLELGPVELELIEYRLPAGSSTPRRRNDVGAAHLCFTVDDLDTTCARLAAAGASMLSGTVTSTSGPRAGKRSVNLVDPEGNLVELAQAGIA